MRAPRSVLSAHACIPALPQDVFVSRHQGNLRLHCMCRTIATFTTAISIITRSTKHFPPPAPRNHRRCHHCHHLYHLYHHLYHHHCHRTYHCLCHHHPVASPPFLPPPPSSPPVTPPPHTLFRGRHIYLQTFLAATCSTFIASAAALRTGGGGRCSRRNSNCCALGDRNPRRCGIYLFERSVSRDVAPRAAAEPFGRWLSRQRRGALRDSTAERRRKTAMLCCHTHRRQLARFACQSWKPQSL